ncbi:MAG: serine/threonine protein kinase [Planctomycetaceae bacterium]|jgi:serine/threonine protein kinase|nr:serine/threonine protein kinase [Planctomycetaceae bacterium]
MDNTVSLNPHSNPSLDEQIDSLADQFEHSWTAQSIYHLETTITTLPENIQQTALNELLLMEFELRFKNGLPVHLKNYKKLFPQFSTEIESLYKNIMESRQLGEYEFYECIGQGGMGTVYRARHRLLDRFVAIKLLRNNILEYAGGIERVLREIRLCGQLLHPNIIKTEYAGKENDRYYLVMELINGNDIRKIIEQYGVLPLPVVCEIIRQAASGLQYAFERNIIHRDIKPGNLMISHDGVVKILDFGLGKFIAVNHPELDYSLTTMGSTMGSVDYIAPEQWEDAASAKIQADIYSLGCLFFFLLNSHAPYENPQLNREQRMIAHIKGGIPPLSPNSDNIPPKIENCYKKMMAKNPKDRFAEPAEIIAILEPFATKDLLPILASVGISPTIPDNSTTLSIQSFPSRRLFGTVFLKKYLPRTVLMILVCYGIYFAGTMKSSRNNDTKKIDTKTLNIAQLHSDPTTLPPITPPIFSHPSLAETLQFIGYSGRWWFEEIPWFLPFVREAAAISAEQNIFFLRNKNISTEFITSFIPKQESAKQLLDFLVTTSVDQTQKLADFESLVNNYLTETNSEINSDTNSDSTPSASILHTQAILLHHLTIQKNNPDIGLQARKLYDKAIECYDNNATKTSRLLGNLCRFDAAQLNWWFDENAEFFYRLINTIKTTQEDDTAFRAELLAISAERFMDAGQIRDDFFTEAFNLIENATNSPIPHPMLERLHTRYAIALSRQWRLAAAEPHWNKVQELAIDTAVLSGVNPQLARLSEGAGQARLNLAISARYFGDLNQARFRCRDLIGNIQDVLAYHDVLPEQEKQRLTQQLTETMECLADCTLFTPTHFGKHPIPNSRFFVTESESWYSQAHEITSDPQTKFILRCKLALLRLNIGNLSPEEYQKIHDEIQNDYSQLVSVAQIDDRTTEYYQTVDALFGHSKSENDSDINRIKNLLDNNRLNNNMVDRYAGERLDLQLFCIRLLLKTEQQNGTEFLQQDVERYLDPILLQHLESATKMRPFLLPFYDLAVNCRKNNDLLQTVLTIRAARCQRYSGLLPKSLLVFYFPIGSENGFAIFLLPGQQENKRFDLGFNRQQVLAAVENRQSLMLPEELVSTVKQQWSQSIPVDVSWDDSMCWNSAQIKNRLSNTQWVFDTQLPATLIWGIVR